MSGIDPRASQIRSGADRKGSICGCYVQSTGEGTFCNAIEINGDIDLWTLQITFASSNCGEQANAIVISSPPSVGEGNVHYCDRFGMEFG